MAYAGHAAKSLQSMIIRASGFSTFGVEEFEALVAVGSPRAHPVCVFFSLSRPTSRPSRHRYFGADPDQRPLARSQGIALRWLSIESGGSRLPSRHRFAQPHWHPLQQGRTFDCCKNRVDLQFNDPLFELNDPLGSTFRPINQQIVYVLGDN